MTCLNGLFKTTKRGRENDPYGNKKYKFKQKGYIIHTSESLKQTQEWLISIFLIQLFFYSPLVFF